MGKIDLRTRSAVDLIPNRCSSNRHPPIMYNSGNVQICNYWKQRIFKEERGVIANLEQQKTRAAIAAITLIDHSDHETAERGLRPPNLAQRPLTPNLAQRPHTLV